MKRLLAYLCLAFCLMAAPAYAFFSLLDAKNAMVDFLLDQLSTEGEFVITAEEVTELEEGATAITGLQIADAEGVWFRAASLSFTWDASRLLRGEVEFNTLIMSDVEVLRNPVQPPRLEPEEGVSSPQEEGLFVWPRSPITLRIDRMALERVSLADAVLGHAIAFDAEGSARDEGDVQSVALNLKRTDRIDGSIDFTYARNFADNTLAVDLKAAEAAGGLVAHLAGLPDDAASAVTLKAEGPPTDWRTVFDLDLAEVVKAGGTATVSYEGPLKVDAAFTARPGPKMPQDFAILLGERAELVARVNEGAEGIIEIAEGRITSPELRLVVAGSVAPQTGTSDLTVDLDAGGRLAEPFEGVDFTGVNFTGTVTGPPDNLRARGDLKLEGLRTAPADVATAVLTVDVTSAQATGPRRTDFDVSGETAGLRLDRISAGTIGTARLIARGSLTGDALVLERAGIESNVLTVRANGTGNLADTSFDLGFGLGVARLAPVAAAYGVDASGAIALDGTLQVRGENVKLASAIELTDFAHPMADAAKLRLEGKVEVAGETTTFDLSGKGERLRIDRIDAALLPTAELSARGQLAESLLTLDRFSLSSPLLTASAAGRMTLESGEGRMTYEVAMPDLGRVAQRYDLALAGDLSMAGAADLPAAGAAPRLDGKISVAGLGWDGTRYGDLSLEHDVRVSEAPEGTLALDLAGSPYGDAQLRTAFAYAEPKLTLGGLDVSALGLSASGDLTVLTDGPLVDGKLAIRARDLAPAGRLAGVGLRGNGTGEISLQAVESRQDARVALRLARLSVEGTTIDGLRVDGTLRDVLGQLAMDLRANASGATVADARIDTANVTARGSLSGLDVTASASGTALDKPVTADMAARISAAGDTVRATVRRFEAALDTDRLALNAPLQVTARGGVTSLRGIDLSLPEGGMATGDLTLAGRPVSGDLTLRLPSLEFVKRFAEIPVRKGGVDASLSFTGRDGRATAQARGVEFEDVDTAGAIDLNASAEWQGRRLSLEATATGGFGEPLSASAILPLRRAGGLPEIAGRGPVEGSVKWSGDIGQLWALVPLPGHVLAGRTKVDLGVTGDIGAPELTGGITVENGSYQNLDLGTILTDLNVETSLLDGGNLGLKLTASDGAKGTVTVDGRVALDASGIDLATSVDHAVLVRRDDVIARIDGDIGIAGPANALDVTGELVIEEADVRLVNANPPSIVTLGDVRIKGEPPEEERQRTSTVDLDLRITAPGRIFVRGRGLDSQWRADIRVTGDAANPSVDGSIERVRGRLDLIGKGFDLTRGIISFNGNGKIDPRIDIVLSRSTPDLTGNIVVSGRASSPELTFTSSPALPEDEVMPRLLFGKSRQALTGSQAIQLSIGLATLMDGGAGTLDAARAAVGLDSLRIEQDEAGQASVTVGKEVAEGVFVGTERSLGDGGTSVTVEIDVFDNIRVDTEVDSDGGASVGLQWKKDF